MDPRSGHGSDRIEHHPRSASPDMSAAMARLLVRLSARYCWDRDPADAVARADRVLLRSMDVGVWEDVLELEATAGRERLRRVLASCPAGGMTPRSWSFWHYRLGLAEVGRGPPPMPTRRTG